jgi:erythromycin esterase
MGRPRPGSPPRVNDIAAIARPLHDAGDLDVLLDRAAGARVVLIGEASHGTHEFYAWRPG